MASLNKVMQMWHAYKREDKRRRHLGYYQTKEDAEEAERLGEKTDKAWSHQKRATKRADKVISRLAELRKDGGDY